MVFIMITVLFILNQNAKEEEKLEVMYQDRYAVICQFNPHNRSICYWRNNLSVKDFRKEGDKLILEDSGSFSGLDVELKVCVDEKRFRSLFHEKMMGEIAFRGCPEHMGIMVRMRKDYFPRTCKGMGEGFEYEFSMEGSVKDLAYKNHSIAGKGTVRGIKEELEKPEI